MKKLLLLTAVAFMFAACNKCKECTMEDSDGSNFEYTTYDQNGNIETYGDQITEVCSDNFETKKDFKDYIEEMEDQGAECKSDFWN
jgi:hypothetical protein